MRIFSQTVFISLVFLFSSVATADVGIYTGLELGTWRSTFKQKANSIETSIDSDLGPAIQGLFAVHGGMLILEYTPHWLPAHLGNKVEGDFEPNDVTSWSLLSGNIGLRLPIAKIHVYTGGGVNHYAFTSGADTSYAGGALKLGASVKLAGGGLAAIRLRGEYQRHYISSDDSGKLPSGVTTRANIFLLTIGFVFGD